LLRAEVTLASVSAPVPARLKRGLRSDCYRYIVEMSKKKKVFLVTTKSTEYADA